MSLFFADDLLPYVIRHLVDPSARSTLLAGLATCQAWHPIFKAALFSNIDLTTRIPLGPHDDAGASDGSGNSEDSKGDQRQAFNGDATVERQSRLLLNSLIAKPENGQLVKTLKTSEPEQVPLITPCSRLKELHVGSISGHIGLVHWRALLKDPPAQSAAQAELCLDSLNILFCTNICTEAVLDLLSCGPNISELYFQFMDVREPTLWSQCSLLPRLVRLHIDRETVFTQTVIEALVVKHAATLEHLWLNVMDDGAPGLTEFGIGDAQCWSAYPGLAFPRLKFIGLAYASLVAAADLVHRSPKIESLALRYCFHDHDASTVLRQLPPTLRRLCWWAIGDDLEVSLAYAQCLEDPSWLPQLPARPDLRLNFGLGDHRTTLILQRRVAKALRARGFSGAIPAELLQAVW